MDTNNRNQENDDDENVYGMKKITYWEKYGVKRFPYRGRRKYTPLIYQSEDGGMIISNDVFGLTIQQFERTYKDCLNRRKIHEQWIINLRYPDKSSNKYLEYLQNCTDYNKDHLPCPENDLYELLVRTVGTEIDIRTRQRLLIIKDMIYNTMVYKTQISSGSLAEGLDLPGSDEDIMFVINEVDVIENVRNIKEPKPRSTCTLVMETDNDHPGFSKLRLIASRDIHPCNANFFESTRQGLYLSTTGLLDDITKRQNPYQQLIYHGPCISTMDLQVDYAFCLRSRYLPKNATPWVWRYRKQWPPNFVIEKIKQYGCLLVPVGPHHMSDSNILWRLSFSWAEKQLVYSFNFTQFLCYGLLKLTLKHIVNTHDDIKDLVCSYFLKTALFWVSEEVDIETFQIPKLFFCFFLCLNKLRSWINNCYCPNYFIPEHNMFLGKITQNNNKMLINVLNSIQVGGIAGLIRNVFPPSNRNYLFTKIDTSFIMLDFLFYRIEQLTRHPTHILQCYKVMTLIKTLLKSESSAFIIDAFKHYYVKFCQYAVQLLPSPTRIYRTHNIHKRYHRHLQDGIKADAVSGWLLYASFYYVIGHYNVTLILTDYVLSRHSPDMVYLCHNTEERINSYRQNVHSTMTLFERINIATVGCVECLQHSSLIPGELQLEVEHSGISIPCIIMSYCLRFLCYHHLGNISNRQKTLSDFFCIVTEEWAKGFKRSSDALTILGVCMELSGDKNTAYECFQNAVQCEFMTCPSAKVRISKLFSV